jgi:hypothetical protein
VGGVARYPKEKEIMVRHWIRKDARDMLKMEKEAEGNYNTSSESEGDEDARIEDQVMYGSDSHSDIDNMVNAQSSHASDSEVYYAEGDYGDYDEEVESEEMAFSDNQQPEESKIKFYDDASDSSKEENKSANSDTDRTPRNDSATGTESSLIDSSYEMDEDGNLNKKMSSKGTALEMVDLRKKKSNPPTTIRREFNMTEFEPDGKVN